jgi:hypothetical protein
VAGEAIQWVTALTVERNPREGEGPESEITSRPRRLVIEVVIRL